MNVDKQIEISEEILEWSEKIEYFWCNCMCLDRNKEFCDMSCQIAFLTLAKKSSSKSLKNLRSLKDNETLTN